MKRMLKTGVFGVLNDGSKFVIIEDKLVYQSGEFDCVEALNYELVFHFSGRRIDKLYNASCFDDMSKSSLRPFFDRAALRPVEMTIAEIEKKLNIKNLKIVKEK